jgi:hypothetical protein
MGGLMISGKPIFIKRKARTNITATKKMQEGALEKDAFLH